MLDCANKHVLLVGTPDTFNVTESVAIVALPVALSAAPFALPEFAQPLPAAPALPHGQAICVPSQ
jgi:hypothetical protein